MSIDEILSRLDGVKGGDGQWSACCPAHDDKRQSLSVGVGEDGKVLLHCHAGCAVEDIAAATGLTMRDLFVEDKPPDRSRSTAGKSPVVATYNYLDDAGQLLAQKLRRADKTFSWRRPDGKTFLCDDEPCKPGYDGRQLLLASSLPHQSTPISDGIIGRLPQLISSADCCYSMRPLDKNVLSWN